MPNKSHYKVVIIGSGPAGLTAAIYASRANLEPLVLEGVQPGGQLTTTTEVENYPGFEHGIQGTELMDVTRKQAVRFGTEVATDTVVDADLDQRPFTLSLESGAKVTCDALIIASGATAKYLGLPSEQKLMGHGVSACATCDGFFFRGQGSRHRRRRRHRHGRGELPHEVRLEGLARPPPERLPRLEDHGPAGPRQPEDRGRLGQHRRPRSSASPKRGVRGIRVKNLKTGAEREIPVKGYFSAIGHEPNTKIFRGKLAMNDVGYLEVKHPTTYTSVEGVFAAGDVADHIYRQAVSAAGEGCKSAIDVERWLAK